MFEDTLKSIKAQLYDRVSSPLMGSFILSWVVWNYKFILVLLSDEKVTEKFNIIHCDLYPAISCTILYGVLLPLLTALLYIFAYPFPARFVYKYHKQKQKELRGIKQEVEGDELLTVKQSRKLRSQIFNLEEQHSKETQDLRSELAQLQSQADFNDTQVDINLRKARKEIRELKETIEKLKKPEVDNKHFDNELLVLNILSSNKGRMTYSDLIAKTKLNHSFAEFICEQLQTKGLVSMSGGSLYTDSQINLNPRGREYLVNNDLLV